MQIRHVSIKALVVTLLSLLGLVVIGLSIFTSFEFKRAALESQSQSLSRSVAVAAKEALLKTHNLGVELAEDAQKSSSFRSAVSTLQQAPADNENRQALIEFLDSQFHQRYVTAGILVLKKLRLYDKSFNLLVASKEGISALPDQLPDFLLKQAQARQGADRYKALGGVWLTSNEALYSVLAPVGGLRLLGYIEVVIEPAYNLREIARIMQVPLSIQTPQGKTLFKSDNWQADKNTLFVSYDVLTTTAQPALHITVVENVAALFASIQKTQWITIGTFIVIILLGIGITLWLLKQYLFEPLKMLVQGLDQCAHGDLTVEISRDGLKDMYIFSGALLSLINNLRSQVGQIQNHATQVSQAAEQLAAVTQQTEQGMEQQQQQTEQLSTAMNEMVATVQEVANNASQAADGAQQADEQALHGKQVVQATIEGNNNLAREVKRAAEVINELEQKSTDISSVLGVIKGIAEQTNLLALNAAIEAARAGEQGRGFAVVADEVRTLATRTQQSTLEIQEIVESFHQGSHEAVQVMEQGNDCAQSTMQQAQEAGESLDVIVQAVHSINDMNTQIASAAEEQGAVAEEINRNIISINQVTEETSHNTQQTTTSCEELAGLADDLKKLVANFKV